jgi:hypothetical protein
MLRALICGSAGALLVWSASLLIPDRYTSRALVRLDVEPFPAMDAIHSAWQETVSRQSLSDLIQRLNLYRAERERLPLEDVIETMKREDMKIDIQEGHRLQMSFAYHDPAGAQAALAALVEAMLAANRALLRQNPAWGVLEVKQVAGPAAGVTNMAFWRPARYVSHAVLGQQHEKYPIDEARLDKRFRAIEDEVLNPEMISRLIAEKKLYPALWEGGDDSEARKDFQRDLHLDRAQETLTITFTSPNAQLAQAAVQGLITRIVDMDIVHRCDEAPKTVAADPMQMSNLESVLDHAAPAEETAPFVPSQAAAATVAAIVPRKNDCAGSRSVEAVDLLDPPTLPEEPDGPVRSVIAIYGFLLGIGFWTAIKDDRAAG